MVVHVQIETEYQKFVNLPENISTHLSTIPNSRYLQFQKRTKKRHNRVHISSFDCNSLSSNQEDYNNNNKKKKKKNNWNYKAKIWKEKQRGRKGLITCNTKNEDEEEKRLKSYSQFSTAT